MTYDGLVIAIFVIVGIIFCGIVMGTNWLLSPHKKYPEKYESYECGVKPIGPVWVRFRPGFYVYALLYVVFDIETVFLYPFALAYNVTGWFIFIEMIIFISILVIGLVYAWREGALTWR